MLPLATTIRLAVTAAVAVAAAAVPTSARASGQTSVTVFLKAPNPSALAALAVASPHLARAQRLAALERLTPGSAEHATTQQVLGTHGLRVTAETAWTVTLTGPTRAVAALFGARPAVAAGALPAVPAALRDTVSAAFPTAGPALFHHSAAQTLDGNDFRNAYTPANVTPQVGTDGATIATMQLSNFNSGDLTAYANEHHLPDPVANGKFRAVQVDAGPSDSSGAVEVDLDQEAILSTSPAAHQHAYFGPNTAVGYGDVFAQVYDDVVGNKYAKLPDAHIVAMSTSWGMCESGAPASLINTYEPIIAALDAAGVTVFAASGDFGIYDCGDPSGTGFLNAQADVDFPASSPHVVGVGGTNLQFTGSASAPNDGNNWAESAWSCSDAVSCQSQIPPIAGGGGGTGGSGGGVSGSAYDGSSGSFAGFAAPVYQSATVHTAPFAGAKKRLVPDIAADGDPSTGFVEYSGGQDQQAGGTSLASPLAAALFTNALSAAGRTTGVGDIHGALYSAYAAHDTAVLRDVTSGTNGASSDRGKDPSVSAQAGYDTVTGLGAVLWQGLMPYLLSSGPLGGTSASLALPNLHRGTATTAVRATWSSKPGSDRLLSGAAVSITRAGTSTPVYSAFTSLSGSRTFTGTPGATYKLVARAADIGGHLGPAVTRTVIVPIDDARFGRHGSWKRYRGGADVAGSHLATHSRDAYLTVTATGRSYSLNTVMCNGCGEVGVYLGSRRVATLNLYSSRTRDATLHFYGGSHTSRARRTFTLRYLGRKSSRSHGTSVNVDALTVTT